MDITKTENGRKGATMPDSTRRIETRNWTKLADVSNITINIAPARKTGLLGKDSAVTVIDEMAPTYGIEKVIFNPPATIVIWSDGEKTVVKTSKDDVFSKETGLAMAIAKRYFGSRSRFLKAVENAEGEAPETPTPVGNVEVAYLCDGKACRNPTWCDAVCSHTTDIRHAANFKQLAPNQWFEKGGFWG